MYLEFVVGPVLSLLLAMKFGAMKDKEREKEIAALQEKVVLLEKSASTLESELPKKVMAKISAELRPELCRYQKVLSSTTVLGSGYMTTEFI